MPGVGMETGGEDGMVRLWDRRVGRNPRGLMAATARTGRICTLRGLQVRMMPCVLGQYTVLLSTRFYDSVTICRFNLFFTGPPVPATARVRTTPQRLVTVF
eukprot:1196081-Prorocentrum_minimum.AAC.4